MKRFSRFLLCTALIAASAALFAQDGPFVPCPDCAARTTTTYPASGPWANTEQTGSGFLLNIQNGVLAGFYFGYDDEGNPVWLLFSGPLQPGPEDSIVQWQVEATLSRFSGGSCLECDYAPPTDQAPAGTVLLKFFQRNHASYQFNDGQEVYMVPLLYGSAGYAHFAEVTPYLLPELGADGGDASPWVLTFYNPESNQNLHNALILHFEAAEFLMGGEVGLVVGYSSRERISMPSPATPSATVACGDFSAEGSVKCRVYVDSLFQDLSGIYWMPVGNLGASHFKAESEDGRTVEGFRIGYD